MTKTVLQNKAINFRKKGKSLKYIAHYLNVSVGSVSRWCRDIPITREYQELLLQNMKNGASRGRIMSALKKRKKRLDEINNLLEKGKNDVGFISKRDFFIAGLSLYWGEGFKTNDGSVGFSVGDYRMAIFLIKWMNVFLGFYKNNISLRLTINNIYKDKENEIKKFWINKLDVNVNQFQKTMFIKTNNNRKYLDSNNYNGTIRIVARNSVRGLRVIKGWLSGLIVD
ncbi:MAG: hypothetical protein COV57_00465 [Candidatus Liptonbacteria bacterium CG11_big_fil_rev_8_21_14_0_20_35_14]|uniref:Uncharacterized protein n=1 Tax=Candidatus Liptonbacteria bacterium CG11_big_fil_rev_8_21_14_0_20_35_14 TaxID=1974634 RepID=A0A2H0N8F9_9BACT|nr:MAG: hypothetical protein COV57_00465 [Candidatus Liptonbacteria bacterium CG11_big_fil_rev_8_21_14_0_20_35_14]